MKENEPTERYEDRSSNLMHAYYAVNSVDGRRKRNFNTDKTNVKDYFNNVMEQGSLFFDAFFTFNFKWDGILPHPTMSVLPKIKATPAYLNVNPNFIDSQKGYREVPTQTNRPNVCNTTNK